MTTDQLRVLFLNFFKKRGHTVAESDLLIPRHDPTLLFTGAGMNQFKDQFMGRNVTFTRAATCQKCLRTGDLDKVGKTAGHHTFFEMLGNFSFGDYFKREAITWAWEFLTREARLPKERLWASVFEEDEEAYDIWRDEIKLPQERIIKFGDKDNFWPSEVKKNGPNGPCGPCSEIFYDWGREVGCRKPDCGPSCECDRFVEVWNLVFTQFERREGGVLDPLPMKNIDTGMGLERLAAVVQNKKTNFGIDTFSYVIKAIAKELVVRQGEDNETDSHLNAIADHVRAATVAISDGARPSNESRGFVVRKLIRKASQRARSLGVYEPFMFKIVPVVAKAMKAPYPELLKRREDIASVVLSEEKNLEEILNTVLPRLEEDLASLIDSGKKIVPGELIFRYYDEKGLPLDLIEEKAEECKMELDREGFDRLLEEQKERSRDKSKVSGSIFFEKLSDIDLKTKFLYTKTEANAKVLGILRERDGKTERVQSAGEGDWVHIALDTTPFYGEAGGQAGDKGTITGKNLKAQINGAKKFEDTIDHIGVVLKGALKVNDRVEAKIDIKRRQGIMKNHTATHLLHSSLKSVLGSHVRQYGSLVDEDRLRFDFTHPKRIEPRELERIEENVNDFIFKEIPVKTVVMNLAEAKNAGAIALFGEKYKDKVMVRTIGDVSMELCGGTHVGKTNDIGVFKILSESSIASGVRRIEALTGEAVYAWLKEDIDKTISEYRRYIDNMEKIDPVAKETIERIVNYLKPVLVRSDILSKRPIEKLARTDVKVWTRELRPVLVRMIDDLSRELKKAKKKKKSDKLGELSKDIDSLIMNAIDAGGIRIISSEIKGADMGILRGLADAIKKRSKLTAILLGSRDPVRANLVCGVTGDLVKKGFSASEIIKEIVGAISGSGGGRPDMAQAGGPRPDGLDRALEAFTKVIKEVRVR
ncbi:MAG: alanine--tRNA ligase [Candidatus Omnitrophota bacterium]